MPCMSFSLIFISYDIVQQYHTSAVFILNSTNADFIHLIHPYMTFLGHRPIPVS